MPPPATMTGLPSGGPGNPICRPPSPMLGGHPFERQKPRKRPCRRASAGNPGDCRAGTSRPASLLARQRTGFPRAIHHPPDGGAHSGSLAWRQCRGVPPSGKLRFVSIWDN